MFLTAKSFQSVQILIFMAYYRLGPMPILQFAIEIVLTIYSEVPNRQADRKKQAGILIGK